MHNRFSAGSTKRLFGVFLLMAAVLPTASLASEQTNANISFISVDNNGGPYVFIGTGSRTTKPACATDDFWAISNPTTDNAKAILANIMTAYSLGEKVLINGTGTCDSTQPTREKVNFIIML